MSVNTKILNVDLGDKSYPIYIGTGILSSKSVLTKHIQGKQVMIVTNSTIAPLYLEKLKAVLEGFNVESVVLPDGEKFKTLETLNKVFDALLKAKFDRSSTLVALGGGVVGDIAGFHYLAIGVICSGCDSQSDFSSVDFHAIYDMVHQSGCLAKANRKNSRGKWIHCATVAEFLVFTDKALDVAQGVH